MKRLDGSKKIVVTFQTVGKTTWEEIWSTNLIDIFKKDCTVIEIRDKETDNIIYSREENK